MYQTGHWCEVHCSLGNDLPRISIIFIFHHQYLFFDVLFCNQLYFSSLNKLCSLTKRPQTSGSMAMALVFPRFKALRLSFRISRPLSPRWAKLVALSHHTVVVVLRKTSLSSLATLELSDARSWWTRDTLKSPSSTKQMPPGGKRWPETQSLKPTSGQWRSTTTDNWMGNLWSAPWLGSTSKIQLCSSSNGIVQRSCASKLCNLFVML